MGKDGGQVADLRKRPILGEGKSNSVVGQVQIAEAAAESESFYLQAVEAGRGMLAPFGGKIDEAVQSAAQRAKLVLVRRGVVHVIGE